MTLWLAIGDGLLLQPLADHLFLRGSQREECGEGAEKKCSSILARTHIMMVLTVMFFVFSCVLSLSPAGSGGENEHLDSVLRRTARQSLPGWRRSSAMIAITKSFLGHCLGAREGFNGMVIKSCAVRQID